MPKCVERRAETTPMPNSRAMVMASVIARMPMTKLKPFSPSRVAATGVTFLGLRFGFGLMTPARTRSR